jgi:hypothetical protein
MINPGKFERFVTARMQDMRHHQARAETKEVGKDQIKEVGVFHVKATEFCPAV